MESALIRSGALVYDESVTIKVQPLKGLRNGDIEKVRSLSTQFNLGVRLSLSLSLVPLKGLRNGDIEKVRSLSFSTLTP